MPIFSFLAIPRTALNIVGPDPFADLHNRNPGVTNTTTMTIDDSAYAELRVNDDEVQLHDGDMNQVLAQGTTFNGTFYPAGTIIENEYNYIIRPVGSVNPADNITLVAIKIGTTMVGFAATERLLPGVDYRFQAGGDDGPTTDYAALVVCFTTGTQIDTPHGPRPVETLRAGDLVLTRDDGPQRLVWAGRQIARGQGAMAPVRVAAGVLGQPRDLYLSQQHRVLVMQGRDEVLTPVKALLGQPGVKLVPHVQVGYHHLLFDRHQVVTADGAAAESLLPGPEALRALPAPDRAAILLRFPELRRGLEWAPARPLIKPGVWRRRAG